MYGILNEVEFQRYWVFCSHLIWNKNNLMIILQHDHFTTHYIYFSLLWKIIAFLQLPNRAFNFFPFQDGSLIYLFSTWWSRKETKPYPFDRPVLWSHITLASLQIMREDRKVNSRNQNIFQGWVTCWKVPPS